MLDSAKVEVSNQGLRDPIVGARLFAHGFCFAFPLDQRGRRANQTAILTALASSPSGRIAFDEVEGHLHALSESDRAEDPVERQVSAGIELIEAGLAIIDGESLQITDAGRSVMAIAEEAIKYVPRSTVLTSDLRRRT
jgi:hypothetical protein